MIASVAFGGAAAALLGLAAYSRRMERRRRGHVVAELECARDRGSDRASLQHPHVDLSRCMGCGLCVSACPEDGVLEVVLGQARVVHGARCVGHGQCAAVCPVDAIAVTLGDTSNRTDLPALTNEFEAVGSPGVFLAGEVTGFALVRTAVAQGTSVGNEVARRTKLLNGGRSADVHDLVVVGAGPAGLACALVAREAGLDFVVIEKERTVGGSVAGYPRNKLVMTQPMELALHGTLRESTYAKEELVELWERLSVEHSLPISFDGVLDRVERTADALILHTTGGVFRTRNVCLALGRRGVPRKLGVPGEDLPKVAYSLLDARQYAGRDVLVVGGGDSAIEAALGLASQPGTCVTISYRKPAFFRLKARNDAAIQAAIHDGIVSTALGTQVVRIEDQLVVLRDVDHGETSLPNDNVFVFAGGEPPFRLLERCGVSFDPALRPTDDLPGERGSGLAPALVALSAVMLTAAAWVSIHAGYFALDAVARAEHVDHGWLRPARAAGLACGVLAVGAAIVNLAYLLRRGPRVPLSIGSLRSWMTVHVATGVGAFVLALLHSGLAPRATTGGRALAAMSLLVVTGAIGRYLYAYVPRAASGSELALEQTKSRLAALESEWEGDHPEFRDAVRTRVLELVAATHWSRGLPRRIAAVLASHYRLARALRQLRARGLAEDVPPARVDELLELARRSHRASLAATWFDEIRALMASWRYLHRWVAFGMVLLVAVHVWEAVLYGHLGWEPSR